jgi:hypothetical protein
VEAAAKSAIADLLDAAGDSVGRAGAAGAAGAAGVAALLELAAAGVPLDMLLNRAIRVRMTRGAPVADASVAYPDAAVAAAAALCALPSDASLAMRSESTQAAAAAGAFAFAPVSEIRVDGAAG